MNPRIQHVVAAHEDYTLTLKFANGETRVFDLRPYLGYPVFEPFRNISFLSWRGRRTEPSFGRRTLISIPTLFIWKAMRSIPSRQRDVAGLSGLVAFYSQTDMQ